MAMVPPPVSGLLAGRKGGSKDGTFCAFFMGQMEIHIADNFNHNMFVFFVRNLIAFNTLPKTWPSKLFILTFYQPASRIS